MQNLLVSTTGAIVNVVALLFVGGFAVWGFYKGFTKTFFNVFGTLLAVLFAVLLAPIVAEFLESKFAFVTSMSQKIEGLLIKSFGEDLMNVPLSHVAEEYLKKAGLSDWLIKAIMSIKSDSVAIPETTTLGQIVCPIFGYYIVMIIVVVALFIIFKIIFFLIGELVKKAYAFKVVAVVDRVLGLAIGFVSGTISLELVIMVIGIIPIPFFQNIYAEIVNSVLVGFLVKINLFEWIMSKISIKDIVPYVKNLIIKA